MGILIFSTSGKEHEERLVDLIDALPHRPALEIYHTLLELSERFRRPRDGAIIMVFLLGSREDLLSLLLIKDFFFDIPLILILPDREKETVSLGFKMLPRFVSYGDGTFEDLQSVMGNMLKQYEHRFENNKNNND
ncbi:MAG: hypothetical protein AB2L12_16600 [Smithellaceae bacterium]